MTGFLDCMQERKQGEKKELPENQGKAVLQFFYFLVEVEVSCMCVKGNILRNVLAGKEIAGEALSADIVIPKNEAYSRRGARALSPGMGANGVGGSANGEDDEILSELLMQNGMEFVIDDDGVQRNRQSNQGWTGDSPQGDLRQREHCCSPVHLATGEVPLPPDRISNLALQPDRLSDQALTLLPGQMTEMKSHALASLQIPGVGDSITPQRSSLNGKIRPSSAPAGKDNGTLSQQYVKPHTGLDAVAPPEKHDSDSNSDAPCIIRNRSVLRSTNSVRTEETQLLVPDPGSSKKNCVQQGLAKSTSFQRKSISFHMESLSLTHSQTPNSISVHMESFKTIRYQSGSRFDIFLSYRVASDAKLVERLYDKLSLKEVEENGKVRKLRVFWDKKCLLPGKSWEEGFSKALINSRVVVIMMSRKAYEMEKRHSISSLKETSPCDNFILEHLLAIHLSSRRGEHFSPAILPFCVGDVTEQDGAEDVFSDFFASKCLDLKVVPDIVVRSIQEKAEHYLSDPGIGFHNSISQTAPLTIKEILKTILEYQGCFLRGQSGDAVENCVQTAHSAACRQVLEESTHNTLKFLHFSTPLGAEVTDWLSTYMLLPYVSIFRKHNLDSLFKISQLSLQDVEILNEEFRLSRRISSTVPCSQVGNKVVLVQALKALQNDDRSKLLKDRLFFYRDPASSFRNMILAHNAMEQLFAKPAFVPVLYTFLVFCILFMMLLIVGGIQNNSFSSSRPSSVSWYQVQTSLNGSNWRYVGCPRDGDAAQHCSGALFDSSAATSDPSLIVTRRFPEPHQARYLRIVPELWNQVGVNAPEMRLGVLSEGTADHVHGSLVDFVIIDDGDSDQFWLEDGCNQDGLDPLVGHFASPQEKTGKVQCCLGSLQFHVCTRDGCLGGDRNEEKFTWFEARDLCSAKGWRLCSRAELNEEMSSGCCVANRCGYDNELVWTSTMGGPQLRKACTGDNQCTKGCNIKLGMCRADETSAGFLDSSIAVETSQGGGRSGSQEGSVTVDLLNITWVTGIQLQGGIQEIPVGLISPVCFVQQFTPALGASIGMILVLYKHRVSPSDAVQNGLLPALFFFSIVHAVFVVLMFLDQTVPSVISHNLVCKTWGAWTVVGQFFICFMCTICPACLIIVHLLRPQFFLLTSRAMWTTGIIALGSFGLGGKFWVSALLVGFGLFGAVFVIINLLLRSKSREESRLRMKDVEAAYNRVWEESTARDKEEEEDFGNIPQPMSCTSALQTIKQTIGDLRTELEENKCALTSSKKYPKWRTVLFWGGAVGLGKFGRSGKRVQHTNDIDLLFQEAAILNDYFFHLLSSLFVAESAHLKVEQGPIKKAERALQKVVRKYYRDARNLTDLVRCYVIVDTIPQMWKALKTIMDVSQVSENKSTQECSDDKFFLLTKIKDNFTGTTIGGIRYINLNVELCWTCVSETIESDGLEFLPLHSWGKSDTRRHICEIQMLLSSMHRIKHLDGGHEIFIEVRNLLSE